MPLEPREGSSRMADGERRGRVGVCRSGVHSVSDHVFHLADAASRFDTGRAHVRANGALAASAAATTATSQPDWSFTVVSVFGAARVRAIVPDGWTVKAILHDGRDIADTPIELKSGETLADVQVIVSTKVTTVSGQLADGKGAPLVDGTVIVFADDSAKWSDDSRWVRAIRPDQQGQYQIQGLPPGDYLAVAVDYVEEGLWNDPEYLGSLRRHSQRVTLGDAESKSLSLKPVTP